MAIPLAIERCRSNGIRDSFSETRDSHLRKISIEGRRSFRKKACDPNNRYSRGVRGNACIVASIAEGAFAGLERLSANHRCSGGIGWCTVVGLTLELLSGIDRLPHGRLAHGRLAHSWLADHRARLNRLATGLPCIIVGICLLVLLWVDRIGRAIIFACAT